jgi:hypothetical protein
MGDIALSYLWFDSAGPRMLKMIQHHMKTEKRAMHFYN